MALILVIDDDDMMRGLLRKMLLRAGHDVVDAPDGEGARSHSVRKFRNRLI